MATTHLRSSIDRTVAAQNRVDATAGGLTLVIVAVATFLAPRIRLEKFEAAAGLALDELSLLAAAFAAGGAVLALLLASRALSPLSPQSTTAIDAVVASRPTACQREQIVAALTDELEFHTRYAARKTAWLRRALDATAAAALALILLGLNGGVR